MLVVIQRLNVAAPISFDPEGIVCRLGTGIVPSAVDLNGGTQTLTHSLFLLQERTSLYLSLSCPIFFFSSSIFILIQTLSAQELPYSLNYKSGAYGVGWLSQALQSQLIQIH